MIYTVVKKNSYQDSINLMLLTNRINTLDGVTRSQIMMGTDANKDIFKNSGLYSEEVEKAAPSDMVVVVEADDEKIVDKVLEETKTFLNDLSVKKKENDVKTAKNWDEAMDMLPDANVALFSIPGEYAAPDLEEALDRGDSQTPIVQGLPLTYLHA